jgi:23S rRNA pseudouridine1911/1915/1917 synthase
MSSSPDRLHATAEVTERLDKLLARTHATISRARFQRLIAEGQVSVEGQMVDDSGLLIKAGQTVEVLMPEAKAAEPLGQSIPLDIVFEDKDLIIINKPAGLVVHPAAGHEDGTLVNALIAHCGESLSGIGGVRRPGIVHRIDKDTSGLLVVAKNDMAHQSLSEQFAAHGRDGRMEREYLAFVWGTPQRPRDTISTGIGRATLNRQKMAVSNKADAKEAITHYEIVEKFAAATLMRCRLETGRTHQIRVHMAHIGHPLLGDTTYGAGFKASLTKLGQAARETVKLLKGQALHAAVLGFDHPRSGKHLRFESKLPALLTQLQHNLRV